MTDSPKPLSADGCEYVCCPSNLAASERPPVDPLREALEDLRDRCVSAGLLGLVPDILHLMVLASPAAPRPEGLREAAHRLHDAAWLPGVRAEDRTDLDRLADGAHSAGEVEECGACRGFIALASDTGERP